MQLIKASLLPLAVFTIFCAGGCKKKSQESGTFQLQLQVKYGSQYFALDTFDIDPSSRYVEVEDLMFYLSNMYLVNTNNSLVKVTDVAFFDISNPSTLSITVPNIQGDFTGIKFYCGVDSLLDTAISFSSNPAIPPGLEAGASSMYELPWGYWFEITHGKWDTAWLPIMRNGFVYHIGGYTSLYKPVALNSTFSVCCGATTSKKLTLDFEKIFYSGNAQILNIATQGTIFSDTAASLGGNPDDLIIAQQFSNNFAQAFSLQ